MSDRSRLLLLCLPMLAACGEADTIRLRLREGSQLFTRPTFQRSADEARVQLLVCGQHDPLPGAVDDESGLCSVVLLDAALLEALPQDAALRIQGSAVAPASYQGGRIPFEPGESNAPAVLGAWVTASCFAPFRPEPAVQQVRGELRFEERSAQRWRGQLELHVEGEPGGHTCVQGAQGADFDVRFDVGFDVP